MSDRTDAAATYNPATPTVQALIEERLLEGIISALAPRLPDLRLRSRFAVALVALRCECSRRSPSNVVIYSAMPATTTGDTPTVVREHIRHGSS